jgi:Large ribosomal RNA subunit accumulation protein YceD
MTKTPSEHPWCVPLSVHDVPDNGRHFALTANETLRDAIAKMAGLRALPRLEASFDVVPYGQGGLHVTGRVSATVGQDCVVTLEPLDIEVDEPIELRFSPAAAPAGADAAEVDIAAVDAPEPLIGGAIDLGAIATDFLILGIDPYPRKADAAFEPPAPPDPGDGPFAALAALKKAGGNESK